MSRNSSPKKNSITSSDEYDRLSDLYREAYDRVQSGGTGAGWSGIHHELMNVLRQYGKVPNGRDEAIRKFNFEEIIFQWSDRDNFIHLLLLLQWLDDFKRLFITCPFPIRS